ncbi:MAG: gamma-glutamyltranspeptidase/glutathione hydrolase, partial [Planctomycetota bacterium]
MKLYARAVCGSGLLVLGLVLASCRAADPFGQEPGVPRPEQGAVVSEHPLATRAGLEILEAGGNAADAAVATALVLAVVYPQAGNLGGGGFAVWVPREGEPNTLDFRELAPAGYTPELYQDAAGEVVPERSLATPLAVGVPGSPAGLYELYRQYGSKVQGLTFADLCEPAIRLARDGFEVDAWLARDLRSSKSRVRLEADPGAREIFYPGGAPLAEGQVLKQPRLAATLERLARGGAKAFYGGPIAEAIVQSLRAADERAGIVAGSRSMTLEDLAAYKVEERRPLVGRFRGYEVISMGPPSSGGLVLLQVLAVLNGFPLDAERATAIAGFQLGDDPSSTECGVSPRRVHWWIEALRMAFADRAQHLGDPDKHKVPVGSLLSADWVARRRVSIGEQARPDVMPWAPDPLPESEQTTHLSVLD